MVEWIIAPNGLIEIVQAPEIYVDGIGAIELLNPGTVRIHLVQEQLPIETAAGRPQKIVVAKIVGPLLNIPQTIGQLASCLWRAPEILPEALPPRRGPKLVK